MKIKRISLWSSTFVHTSIAYNFPQKLQQAVRENVRSPFCPLRSVYIPALVIEENIPSCSELWLLSSRLCSITSPHGLASQRGNSNWSFKKMKDGHWILKFGQNCQNCKFLTCECQVSAVMSPSCGFLNSNRPDLGLGAWQPPRSLPR